MLVFLLSLKFNESKKGKTYFRKIIDSYEGNIEKYWYRNRLFRLHSSCDYPESTYYNISEGSVKYEKCTRKLCNNMMKKSVMERNTYFSLINENI